MLYSLGKTLSSSRTETWQEAREVILTCHVLILNVFHSYFLCERRMTTEELLNWTLISTWNKRFNPRSWSYCEQWISVCHSKEKYDHFWYLVVLRWSPNYRVSATHEVESSLVLALMSCSSCIIEGKGSHWETLQWLGDVNRKLIDERRRIHRKFRLPGVLAGWASLPHLLSHSFFSSLFWSVIVKLRGRPTKLVLLHHMCADVRLKGNHWMRHQK